MSRSPVLVPSSIVVLERPEPRYMTGILDPNGQPIYRTDLKNPIGFVWFHEVPQAQMEVD